MRSTYPELRQFVAELAAEPRLGPRIAETVENLFVGGRSRDRPRRMPVLHS